MRYCLIVAAALLLAGMAAQTPPARAEASSSSITHFTLANGLEVVVIPDRRTPVVTQMIWYKVGSADETPGKSGIAHFLEHLMFKGTAKNPAGRFSKMLASIGGLENAFTSTDYTAFFQRVPREHLQAVMEFEADRMTGLVLNEANVQSELNVVLEEYNQRVGNDPSARLTEQIQAALFLNHPYGRPVIGWHHEIERLTLQDALNFYRRFYTPNNAVVVIAGDVSAEEVRSLADRTYAAVEPRADIGPRIRPQEPPPTAIRHVELADPRVNQPSLQRSYLVPSFAAAKGGEAEALDVLAQVIGNGTTGRLYRALVADKGLAASAGGWYQGTALDPSIFTIFAAPRPGVSLPQLEEALDDVLADLNEKGITAAELDRAKNRMIADYVYAQDNQATLARLYGAALTTGSSVEDVLARPERIRAVTVEAVNDALHRWLDKRRSSTGYLVKENSPREDKRS